ncbi:MAG TPA: ATP-grasp domain-containing protein [Usitatibacter sp.]|nr:ATP-grasp domain-containing protein [Usitatibacter sp.]
MLSEIDLPPHHFQPHAPPVLLLGGINLVRTLGLAGIAAIVASPDPHDSVFASRYCVGRCVLPPLEHSEAVADRLITLGDRLSAACGRRVPLMYGSDDFLALIYAHRERLQRYFLLALNDSEVGEALLDKDRFDALARARSLPVPLALAWHGRGAGTLADAKGAVLCKPRCKIDWHASPLHTRLFARDAKARVFSSGAEVLAHPQVALCHEQLIFQDYVEGEDRQLWSFHGVADDLGGLLACFSGRKLRTFPALTGESAFIELAPDEALEALGRDIARRLPLKGVFKMDFKKDRDGRFRLLEINARFNLWLYLGAHNGLNLMRVAYDYLLTGARPPPRQARATYRWLSLSLDYRAYRESAAAKRLGLLAWLFSILNSRNIYNVFAWRDPAPWVRFWLTRFSRLWVRSSQRVLGVVRQWLSTAS